MINQDVKGTKEEKIRENKKKQKGTKKKLQLSPIAFVDNIVFSKTNRWAFYRIANNAYDFLDDNAKVRYANELSNALSALFRDKNEALDCHMISTSIPVDISLWEHQIQKETETWKRAPGFDDYLAEQSYMLKEMQYMRRVTYLGIDMGRRNSVDISDLNFMEVGLSGAKESLKKIGAKVFQVPGEDISQAEENSVKRMEKDLFTTLSSGAMRAQRVSTEELLLLIKRQLWPAMPAPYLNVDHSNRAGSFDLELESASAIRKRYRWLEITQQYKEAEITGYRACLSVGKLPKRLRFPAVSPFLYLPGQLGLPFTVYSRFQIIPSDKMKRELYKKEQEQEDQLQNMADGGHDVDQTILEDMGDMAALKHQLMSDPKPWVKGSYRIVVETSTEEQLRAYCSELSQRYSAQDITLYWTAGDQVDLFLEQMPGDKLRMKSFQLLTNMEMLGISGINVSSDIGDPTYSDVDV